MGGVARRIRAARLSGGWSQVDLADAAGVSRPSIARVEAGGDVNTATLRAICEVLGLEFIVTEHVDD
ncbi:helix-turn-helix protein [Frigoribacterium sp. PhB107]|nr:helix-turn-helix transcriptional regulator [Frigoribacterium sp. PhB107]ROP78856.1 helix-turn-helix protein [Frigoribacterium sp. PhB107]